MTNQQIIDKFIEIKDAIEHGEFEYLCNDTWFDDVTYSSFEEYLTYGYELHEMMNKHRRTPKKKKVPMGYEDMNPYMLFRDECNQNGITPYNIVSYDEDGIILEGCDKMSYEEVYKTFNYCTPDNPEWRPFKKEVADDQ